jgi:predicted acyl esterase
LCGGALSRQIPQEFPKARSVRIRQTRPIAFALPDIAHTFRAGHRIMIQIQSSWFPLTDRNPQKFIDIPKALKTDFVKATQRVYVGGAEGSKITFRMLQD